MYIYLYFLKLFASIFLVGYIATGFANGFINICVIRTLSTRETIILKEIQKVDVWREDDLMHIQFMQWLKKASFLL